jgi:phage tail tape-measure protein
MNTNVIPMNRPVNDMDVMVNLCNTPRQQERRQQKRQKAYRSMRTRMIALHALLVSAGVGMGLMAGILIF